MLISTVTDSNLSKHPEPGRLQVQGWGSCSLCIVTSSVRPCLILMHLDPASFKREKEVKGQRTLIEMGMRIKMSRWGHLDKEKERSSKVCKRSSTQDPLERPRVRAMDAPSRSA